MLALATNAYGPTTFYREDFSTRLTLVVWKIELCFCSNPKELAFFGQWQPSTDRAFYFRHADSASSSLTCRSLPSGCNSTWRAKLGH
jgi:hypothetical protein